MFYGNFHSEEKQSVCQPLFVTYEVNQEKGLISTHLNRAEIRWGGNLLQKKGGIYKDLFKNTHLQWPWILLEVWEKLVFSCSSYKTFALSGIISCFCSWGLPFPEADGADELADILSISEIAESRTHLTLFFLFVASRCGKRGRQQSEYCIKTVKYKTYSIQRAKLESELYFVYQKSLYFLHLKKHKHILKTQLPGTEKVRLTHN